jgi:hypothetical protein
VKFLTDDISDIYHIGETVSVIYFTDQMDVTTIIDNHGIPGLK